jgi:hypothetical protein
MRRTPSPPRWRPRQMRRRVRAPRHSSRTPLPRKAVQAQCTGAGQHASRCGTDRSSDVPARAPSQSRRAAGRRSCDTATTVWRSSSQAARPLPASGTWRSCPTETMCATYRVQPLTGRLQSPPVTGPSEICVVSGPNSHEPFHADEEHGTDAERLRLRESRWRHRVSPGDDGRGNVEPASNVAGDRLAEPAPHESADRGDHTDSSGAARPLRPTC